MRHILALSAARVGWALSLSLSLSKSQHDGTERRGPDPHQWIEGGAAALSNMSSFYCSRAAVTSFSFKPLEGRSLPVTHACMLHHQRPGVRAHVWHLKALFVAPRRQKYNILPHRRNMYILHRRNCRAAGWGTGLGRDQRLVFLSHVWCGVVMRQHPPHTTTMHISILPCGWNSASLQPQARRCHNNAHVSVSRARGFHFFSIVMEGEVCGRV